MQSSVTLSNSIIRLYGIPSRWQALLATIKTTLVLDEKIWSEFRRFVEEAYGTTRKMSAGVEEALRSFTPAAVLEAFASSAGFVLDSYPSSQEIVTHRPKVRTSTARTIRRMRNERRKRLS
jgi:hypothetical protein